MDTPGPFKSNSIKQAYHCNYKTFNQSFLNSVRNNLKKGKIMIWFRNICLSWRFRNNCRSRKVRKEVRKSRSRSRRRRKA